jgi:hypothetical protein
VTTFNHGLFKPFDADTVIDKMMKGKNWKPGHKYWGLNKQSILDMWETNRDEAARAGTKLHNDIECFYNGSPGNNTSIEYQYFMNFVKDFPDVNERPYRTEWTIFHEELRMAGSVDMIFENPEDNGDTLIIYDWKRSREINKVNHWNVFSEIECISHIPDSNYWHYCLQLNTYKAIIESKYQKRVSGMYLVCLHPDNKNGNYQRIRVADLQSEVSQLFNLRRHQLATF